MRAAFRYALRHSFPIFISFIPVGLAYGVLMQTAGMNWAWSAAFSLFVLAGSLQYLAVGFLAGGVSLVTVAVMALLLNSRHIFYGIPFIEQWRKYGPWRLFLIYSLADECFSLHCSNDFDDGDERHKMFSYVFDAMLVVAYWIGLTILGGLLGSLIRFNTAGIDFALTALFIVILLEQLRGADGKLPALIAAVSSIGCLVLFGPANFILPALSVTVVLLFVFRRHITAGEEGAHG